MEYYVIIIAIVTSTVSVASALAAYMSSKERRKNSFRQEKLEERYDLLVQNVLQTRDIENDRRFFNYGKGFSDDYNDIRLLLKEIHLLRNDIRREMSAPLSINTDQITTQVSKAVQQSICDHAKTDELSKQILSELVSQMSFDHFYELKEDHYRSKIHDTSRALLNVLHVLRTPLSGIKINVQSLKKLNDPFNAELGNKYSQIEDAISLIEANMRTLGAYDEISSDSCNLKENIQRNINLLLLTADKRVVLNTDSIPDDIVLPSDIIDNVLTCVSCIVENAIVFSPDNSEIKVEATLADQKCKLSISNSGANIPDDISDKIFTDGFTSRDGGHGIGLNLTKTIVEDKLGGNITFENTVDPIGVTFHIVFEVTQ